MPEDTVEDLVTEIGEKLTALDDKFTPERITEMVKLNMSELMGDEEFVRTIRFAAEPKLVGTKYGRLGMSAADIEMVFHILESARIGGKSSGPSDELRKAFEALSDAEAVDSSIARMRDTRMVEEMFGDGRLDKAGFGKAMASIETVYGRAMDTAETGFGLELIGAQYVSDLWAGARTMSRVAALIPTFPMDAPTAYLPVEADIPEMLFVAESVASNASNYATSKTGSNRVQVDAKKFVIHQMWSGEMEEDSIIAFLPFLRGQAQRSIAHYSDSLVLNGDTTNAGTGNINLDDADPADTKHYLAFDGIRHAALVDNTANAVSAGAALTYNKLVDLRKLGIDGTYLHDWGHPINPADFPFICDPETADEIAQLTEVQTVDKYASGATVLNGEVGNIGRNPLITSIAMSRTEADGKVSTTGANNVLGQVAAFNTNGFTTGIRRSLKVETERIPASDQSRIVYSMRVGFGRFSPTGAASGIEAATVLYNI